jgi:hypothetical protein
VEEWGREDKITGKKKLAVRGQDHRKKEVSGYKL